MLWNTLPSNHSTISLCCTRVKSYSLCLWLLRRYEFDSEGEISWAQQILFQLTADSSTWTPSFFNSCSLNLMHPAFHSSSNYSPQTHPSCSHSSFTFQSHPLKTSDLPILISFLSSSFIFYSSLLLMLCCDQTCQSSRAPSTDIF